MYCVIFGDIIHSRLKNYMEIDGDVDHLTAVLEQINTKYQNSIFTPFGNVRGDAFEGVLFSQQDIPDILRDIIRSCWNERRIALRISAVTGELSKADFERNRANGPAFIKAVTEIDEMRADKSDHWFQVSIVSDTIAQPLIDGILCLLTELTSRWTEKQRELVWAMSDYSSQKNLGTKKKKAPSVVSRQLKAAGYKAYIKAWTCLEKYLKDAEDASVEGLSGKISYTTYYSMGQRKNKLRQYRSAIDDFEKSIKLAMKEFGKRDQRLVPLYNGLAQAHLEILSEDETGTAEREEATKGAEQAIEASLACQKSGPRMTMEYAKTINLQGNYYLERDEYEKALECFEKAKYIIQEKNGPDHPMLLDCDNNIAIAYKRMGKYAKALRIYKNVLDKIEDNQEQNPLDYADSLYNYGLCYYEMKKYPAAKDIIIKAAEIIEAALPAKNEYVIEVKKILHEIEEEIAKSKGAKEVRCIEK